MLEFPKPDPELTQEQALTMILSSIALEEAALSHIMNAEGDKIQHILRQVGCGHFCADINDITAVNKSVTDLLEMVLQNQMILKSKMEKVLEHLPKPPSPPPPPLPPPLPPLPPPSPLPPPIECWSFKQPLCFEIKPKMYHCNEPLQWQKNKLFEGSEVRLDGDCTQIALPRAGSFMVDACMHCANAVHCGRELMLVISCGDTPSITKTICLRHCNSTVVPCKKAFIEIPCAHDPCSASVLVGAPDGLHIQQGRIIFTKL